MLKSLLLYYRGSSLKIFKFSLPPFGKKGIEEGFIQKVTLHHLCRFMLQSLFIYLYLVTSIVVYAEDDEKHPIEKKMDDCMESHSSTAGMKKCAITAEEQWNVELNRIYNILLGKLDEEGKTRLRTTQSLWMKYRDTEFETIHSIYVAIERERGNGTLWKLTPLIARVEVVKNRVLELTQYLNDFNLEEETE